MHGVNSYFHSCKPTQDEYDQCHHIMMTASSSEWDPSSPNFAAQEESMMDGEVRDLRDNLERKANRMTFARRLEQQAVIARRLSHTRLSLIKLKVAYVK
jgi:hypothetical protein